MNFGIPCNVFGGRQEWITTYYNSKIESRKCVSSSHTLRLRIRAKKHGSNEWVTHTESVTKFVLLMDRGTHSTRKKNTLIIEMVYMLFALNSFALHNKVEIKKNCKRSNTLTTDIFIWWKVAITVMTFCILSYISVFRVLSGSTPKIKCRFKVRKNGDRNIRILPMIEKYWTSFIILV